MAGPNDPRLTGAERGSADGDPTSLTLDALDEAEASRPTLPDETADGLDEMDEEIRRQAEDIPIDAPGRL